MQQPSRPPDLHRGDILQRHAVRLGLRFIRHIARINMLIIKECQPPIAIDEQGSPPFQVGLIEPEIVVEPITWRCLVKCFGRLSSQHSWPFERRRRTYQSFLADSTNARLEFIQTLDMTSVCLLVWLSSACLILEKEWLKRCEVLVECFAKVWYRQARQLHRRPWRVGSIRSAGRKPAIRCRQVLHARIVYFLERMGCPTHGEHSLYHCA